MTGSAPSPAGGQTWRHTVRWRPGRSGTASTAAGAGPVECSASREIGYCKTTYVAQERIAAALSQEVSVGVPEFRLGKLEGHAGTVGISIAFGKESLDLRMVRENTAALYVSQPMQEAIRSASGLLPFHAWLGTEDLKDDHLVVAESGSGSYRLAAIDFSYAMKWTDQAHPVHAPNGPPALVSDPDKGIVAATVASIEAVSDERIRQIVSDLPDDILATADRERIIQGPQMRRGKVRAVMQVKGWIA